MAWTSQDWINVIVQATPSLVLIIGAVKGGQIINGIRDDANKNAAAAKVDADVVRDELKKSSTETKKTLDDTQHTLSIVHEQTNSSLTKVKAELVMANEKIANLERLLLQMAAERDEAREEAAKLKEEK